MALCGTHIKENCPLCNTQGTASEPPPPIIGTPIKIKDAVETKPPVPEPVTVSDPVQQKRIDAAKSYADAIEAEAITTSYLNEARETVKALEKQLAALKQRAKDALAKTQEATK